MQETRVCFLIWEDPTYPGATKPKHHHYQAWALDLGAATTETYFPKACALPHEEPPQWESRALQLESSPPLATTREKPVQQQRQSTAKN